MSEPSDREHGVETRAGAEGVPGPDPIGVGRVEFHRALNGLHRDICGEADGLRETFGWLAISLACWLLLIGYFAISGNLRGGARG